MRQEWEHLTEVELRQMLAGYYGMVALVDSYCGMVLDALDRLGIREDTIVIWTSDHGDQMWEHQLFLKFNMHEASIRVPLLIDVPQGDPAVRGELVEHVDVFPTICELVGATCPRSVQGRSLVPLLGAAPAPDGWRDAVFSQIGDIQMIRTQLKKPEQIDSNSPKANTRKPDTRSEWKLNVYDGEPGDLYDLSSDPQEFYNLIAEPGCADTLELLMNRLEEWKRRTCIDVEPTGAK
jgi:arylsulfatase A-like enzyme